MDQREKSENLGALQAEAPLQQRVPIRPRPVARQTQAGNPEPEPVQILARMPNLDVEASARHHSRHRRRNRREDGRLLSSRAAVPLLVTAGVLLLALAVLPSLLSKREAASTNAEEGLAAWRSQEPETWSSTAPDWDASNESVDSAEHGHDPRLAAFSGQSDGASGIPFSPAAAAESAAQPQTVQLQASSRQKPPSGAAGPPDSVISSWRDPGQWPYGNGVGVPDPSVPVPADYPNTAELTASYGLPPGVQGTPIPYAMRGDGSGLPQAGMNRSMALGSPASPPAAAYPAPGPVTTAAPAPDRYGSAAAAYSADARSAGWPQTGASYPNFPTTDSAGSYPSAAESSPAYDGQRYRTTGPTVGTPIPGAAGATGQGAGDWAAPQQPGAARLQGVIEKPSARTNYEYDRPSLY